MLFNEFSHSDGIHMEVKMLNESKTEWLCPEMINFMMLLRLNGSVCLLVNQAS